jgi:hypothetical protein
MVAGFDTARAEPLVYTDCGMAPRPIKRALWRGLQILFALVFLFSALMQYNDPDPVRWVALYGAASLASVLALWGRGSWLLPAAVALAAVAWAATIAPHLGGVRIPDLFAEFEMKDEGVERAREVGGLLIVAVWMLVLVTAALRRPGRPAR